MSKTRYAGLYCTLTLFSLLIAGCGGGPNLATVEGRITLDGKPLAGAQVEFTPISEDDEGPTPEEKPSPVPAYGETDASGYYELMFTADQPGAMPGKYRVSITTEESAEDQDTGKVQSKERVPARYNRASELIRTVEPGKKNVFDFSLES